MTKRILCRILFPMLILVGCGKDKTDMISEHSGLKLPGKYKILVNSSESSGFEGTDVHTQIILEFDEESIVQVRRQADSLVSIDPNWIKFNTGFSYSNQLNEAESENINIDLQKRILSYGFYHF